MSCCRNWRASTMSPTLTPAPRPPATPVKTMRFTPKCWISSVAVVAAATLPMPESTATTSCPCKCPTQNSRPPITCLCSSGISSNTLASSSCKAETMAVRGMHGLQK
ncbi:hypothetical protein Y695_01917 [Hydrogenophaga sp. T4]|nr:hypothetical protein Y695_01917 [Hydrogenophaga sp. T4]